MEGIVASWIRCYSWFMGPKKENRLLLRDAEQLDKDDGNADLLLMMGGSVATDASSTSSHFDDDASFCDLEMPGETQNGSSSLSKSDDAKMSHKERENTPNSLGEPCSPQEANRKPAATTPTSNKIRKNKLDKDTLKVIMDSLKHHKPPSLDVDQFEKFLSHTNRQVQEKIRVLDPDKEEFKQEIDYVRAEAFFKLVVRGASKDNDLDKPTLTWLRRAVGIYKQQNLYDGLELPRTPLQENKSTATRVRSKRIQKLKEKEERDNAGLEALVGAAKDLQPEIARHKAQKLKEAILAKQREKEKLEAARKRPLRRQKNANSRKKPRIERRPVPLSDRQFELWLQHLVDQDTLK